MPDVVMPRDPFDTLETDDRSETNFRSDTSKFEHMKAMTLDFPKLIRSSPECSPEPNERNEEVDTNETKTEHLVVSHEDDDVKPQRVRRCSSLKTGKTPPGTFVW